MFEEKLIKEVKKYPCIYNKKDAGYTNSLVRERTWKAVATSLGVPYERCKGRWRTLKDKFVKDNKKTVSGRPDSPDKVTWKYTKAMSFLKDYISPTPTWTDLDVKFEMEEVLSNASHDPLSPDDPTSTSFDNCNSIISPLFDNSDSVSTSRALKRKAADEGLDKFVEIMGRLTNVAEKVVEKKNSEEDEDSCFCKFLMSILKKVDSDEKHKIKMDILNMASKKVEEVLNKKRK